MMGHFQPDIAFNKSILEEMDNIIIIWKQKY